MTFLPQHKKKHHSAKKERRRKKKLYIRENEQDHLQVEFVVQCLPFLESYGTGNE